MALKLSVFLGILAVIGAASALTCYKCDSSDSMMCNLGIVSFAMPTVNCEDEGNALTSFIPKQCVKLTAKDRNGKEYVARGCVPHLGPVCQAIVKTYGFFNGIAEGVEDVNCYTCNGDKCNSAPKTQVVTFFGLIVAVLVFLF